MKKTQWKRILAFVLAVCILCSVCTEHVFASDSSAVHTESWSLFPELGAPFTDVTTEEAQAFSRSLDRALAAVTDGEASLEQRAKQKAKAMTALYGETSIQYAVMQDGKLMLSDAYGTDDADAQTRVTTDVMYGIASISKLFVTAAVLQLCEASKLELDAPVVSYLPEFTMKDARYRDITVRMLLNHSSGLMGGGLENALLLDDADTSYHDNFLNKLANETLKAAPGAYSVYCNDGFVLAELVIERVTGQTFSDYLQTAIFAPLGLSHTKTTVQLSNADATAGIYTAKGGDALPTEYLNAIGAGGLYSTAEDLCRFGMSFTDHAGALLAADSIEATFVQEGRKGQWCEEVSGAIDYGLGWDSVALYPFADCGIQAAEKGGDSLYYHGMLLVFPEQNLSVAVLSSGGTSTYNGIFGQYLAAEVCKEQGVLTQEQLDAVPTAYTADKQNVPAELSAYSGYYVSMSGTYQIKVKKNSLQLINLSSPKTTMKFLYSGDGYFVYPGGTQALRFCTQNGKKYLMSGTYATLPGISTAFFYMYTAQKAASRKLPASVKQAWQARDGKKYFVVSEKYSSARYVQGGVMVALDLSQSHPGYLFYNKIVDADTAVQFTDMPMNGSRDATDYVFTKTADGAELLHCAGLTAIREDGLKKLSAKASFSVKIGASGAAKWYRIGANTAGKKLTVTLPKTGGAMLAVYDAKGACKFSTYISDKRTVKLPEDGFLVFAGDAGAVMKVKCK